MADELVPSDRSTDVKLHSDLVSVATTQHQPVPEPPQRSLSKISIPPSVGRLIPGHQLGRYELLCPIARGGMASVWVARLQGAHGFEKLVALKTILAEHAADPEYEAMFLDEARIVAGIRHHNVAEILDLGSADGMLYLVLEWVEGDSLALLQRAASRHNSPVPMTVAMRIVAQICAGLHAAHELADRNGKALNVVHRDVSPQNVIVSAAGEVKLIDFGIAKAVDQLSEHTRTGVLKGKISFMSPEQALGQRVDRRADVWAAGVVLYQLLAGRLPFRGENQLETLHLISRKERAPEIPGLPKPLAKLLDRVLEPDLNRRIATAAELEVELERLIGLLGPVTTRDVASVVQQHLGRRIAARREVVDTALRAADGRIKLTQAFNAALEQNGLPDDDEASAIARRRELTTALETPAPGTAPASPSAVAAEASDLLADTARAAQGSRSATSVVVALPALLNQRRWLPWVAVAALVAIVGGALLLRGPAEGDPTRTGVSAPQVPSESEKSPEIQERTEPSEPEAVVPPSALALEAARLPRDDAAVPDERAEQPRAAVKPRPRPAARPAAGPAAPRTAAAATPTAGKKQDVLKAFSERR
jgi:eukaryotic-like serine/threonine-protein kinase